MTAKRGQEQHMNRETIDYQAVIDDLVRRREETIVQFDAAISGIRQVMALSNAGIGQLPLPSLPQRAESPAGKGPYDGLSVVEASMKFLRTMGRAQHHDRIAEA